MRGLAYVTELTTYSFSDHVTVTLHCLPIIPIKNSRSELMTITCAVHDEALIKKLQSCRKMLFADPAIIEFTVKYLGTVALHYCNKPEDPEQIVNIAARLTAIHALYVNGVKQADQSL
jgi:hypothetical protein